MTESTESFPPFAESVRASGVKPDGGDVQSRQSREHEAEFMANLAGIKPDGGGLRHNDLKNRLDLVPPEWPWALADITTRGSLKYAERNWERGMKWSIMVGCALRHLYKFIAGEQYDKEIGCHHLAMAAWNLLALMSYDLKGVGEDDILTSTTMETLEAVANIPIEDVAAAVQAKREGSV